MPLVLWGSGCCVFLVLLAAFAVRATDAFQHVFTTFGAELPLATRIALKLRTIWWAFPVAAGLLAVLAALGSSMTAVYRRRIVKGLIGVTAGAVVIFLVAWYALYLPIFQLGRQV